MASVRARCEGRSRVHCYSSEDARLMSKQDFTQVASNVVQRAAGEKAEPAQATKKQEKPHSQSEQERSEESG